MARLGKFGRLLGGVISGGYEPAPEDTEYDTVDPRQAYFRGVGDDIANIMMGYHPTNAASRYAQEAEAYNREGPERYRQQQLDEARIAREQFQTRAAQTEYADTRIEAARERVERGRLYEAWQAMPPDQRPPTPELYEELLLAEAKRAARTDTPSQRYKFGTLPGGAGSFIFDTQNEQLSIPGGTDGFVDINEVDEGIMEQLGGLQGLRAGEAGAVEADVEARQEFLAGAPAMITTANDNIARLERIQEQLRGMPTGPLVGPAATYFSSAMQELDAALKENVLLRIGEFKAKGISLNPITERELGFLQKTTANPSLYRDANIDILSRQIESYKKVMGDLEEQAEFLRQGGLPSQWKGPSRLTAEGGGQLLQDLEDL